MGNDKEMEENMKLSKGTSRSTFADREGEL